MISEKYDVNKIEAKWQERWHAEHTYAWNPSEPRETSYIIDTPPPTVSGYLHIGHVYSYTQTDLIARYRRMAGQNVFYPMGSTTTACRRSASLRRRAASAPPTCRARNSSPSAMRWCATPRPISARCSEMWR